MLINQFEWEYTEHENYQQTINKECQAIHTDLVSGLFDIPLTTSDTRLIHKRMFIGLVPEGMDYFAGHYRGEKLGFLETYRVFIGGMEGTSPQFVVQQMSALALLILNTNNSLLKNMQLPEAWISRMDKLLYAVSAVCRLFVDFLTIHPYANGNGHIARFLLVAMLRHCGYKVQHIKIDPRPADPPYSRIIEAYRQGNRSLLEEYVLDSMIRRP